MSKNAQTKKASDRARARKTDVAIEEGDRLFATTWEAVMSASDQELDAVSAAVVTAQTKAKERVKSRAAGLVFRAAKEQSGMVVYDAVRKDAQGDKLLINLKVLEEAIKGGGLVTKSHRAKGGYARQRPSLTMSHITTKPKSDDERDWL